METIKVGIREFRSQLPHYLLEAGCPVAITRHGETIGYFIPSKELTSASDIEALKIAGAKIDAMLKEANVDVEEIVTEFHELRRQK
jgi:hypothetical protein